MNERLTSQDLTDLLAAKHGMTKKDAEAVVKEFFILIEEALEKEKYVKIKGLGTFKLIEVESRESVNVNTGERFQIKGHTKVSFTPDSNLRDTINKPFSHFETVVLNDSTILDDTLESEVEEEEPGEEISQTTVDKVEVPMEIIPEKFVIEENKVQKNITPNEIDQEISEQQVIPVIQQESEYIEEKVKYTAEQIIAQELQAAKVKLETPKAQPEMIKPEKDVIPPSEKEKSSIPYLITIIIIVLLLCGGAVLFIYYPDLLSSSSNKPALDMPVATEPAKPIKPEISLSDTIEKKDTVKIKEEIAPNIPKEAVKSPTPTPVYSDTATYIITGTKATHTIKEGETLIKVSLRYYGSKGMWPYIVKHNPKAIKNPDNVPFGTTIQIPELTKK